MRGISAASTDPVGSSTVGGDATVYDAAEVEPANSNDQAPGGPNALGAHSNGNSTSPGAAATSTEGPAISSDSDSDNIPLISRNSNPTDSSTDPRSASGADASTANVAVPSSMEEEAELRSRQASHAEASVSGSAAESFNSGGTARRVTCNSGRALEPAPLPGDRGTATDTPLSGARGLAGKRARSQPVDYAALAGEKREPGTREKLVPEFREKERAEPKERPARQKQEDGETAFTKELRQLMARSGGVSEPGKVCSSSAPSTPFPCPTLV